METSNHYAVGAAVVLVDAFHVLENAVVVVHDGLIVDVGPRTELVTAAIPTVELNRAVLMPGLVNAHTHLALSDLGDLQPPTPGFGPWIQAMAAAARAITPDRLRAGLRRGEQDSIRSGTTAVGDIVPLPVRADAAASPLAGVRFLELLGFDRPFDPAVIGALASDEGLAPHAPYSTSSAIYRGAADLVGPSHRLALHVAESREEEEFLQTGLGPFRALLESFGRLPPGWRAPAISPVAYLDDLGALSPVTLAIHATFATVADRAILARRGATVVTCPRSNRILTGTTADVESLLAAGVAVALGTDSLASSPSLSMLDELRALRALHPGISPPTALAMATAVGASALGLDAGVLARGKRADLAAFPLDAAGDPYASILSATEACFVAIGGRMRIRRE